MFSFIGKMFSIPSLRSKIFLTLFILFLFRVGSHIPVPGINIKAVEAMMGQNALLGFMNTFSGGALGNFSLFAVGIMPYITASIIIQLLQTDIVPQLTEWTKQGELGQKKLKKTTYILAVVLGFVQSLGLSIGFNKMYPGVVENPNTWTYLVIAVVLTIGTAILIFMGEYITKKGVGNGISLIILGGIVSSIPSALVMIYQMNFVNSEMLVISIVKALLILLFLLCIVVFVIFIQQGERRIPIQYAKRVINGQVTSAQKSHLPIKVNAAGVIPVIFAVALFMFPSTIARFFTGNKVAEWIVLNLDYTQPLGMVLYVTLIVSFSYFYAFIQVNPEKMADDLNKQGGSIPTIRPGSDTVAYITTLLYRLTFVSAIFLSVLSIIPMIATMVTNLPSQIQIGGISLLIVISVALDTTKQIQSKMVGTKYEGFLKK